jgi:hypothetical protein
MDWSSLLAAFPKEAVSPLIGVLVGSLIGGFLTLTASITAQYLTHRFTRRRDHERLLREKAEALIEALDQYPDWVVAQATALPNQPDHQASSPLDRALVLQVLYFPQLAPHFITIREAVMPVVQLLVRLRGQPTHVTALGLQPLSMQEKEAAKLGMGRQMLPYLAAKDSVVEALLATSQLFAHVRRG